MILNLISTGKPCPREVESLREAIPVGSLMCYIEVHAMDLAKVLDRLEALETYEKIVRALSADLVTGANKYRRFDGEEATE